MSSDRSSLTDNQLKVKKYFEKYNIEETLGDLLNTLAHNQDEKPMVFMVKYLANLCTKEELELAGITLNNPNSSQMNSQSSILAILYPEFEPLCNNLFKTYLTKEVFLNIKNKKTLKFNNTIRPILQAALENQNSKFGCYMADSESYEVFQSLLGPILDEINQGVNIRGFKYQKDYGFLKNLKETKLTTELQYIKNLKVKVKRNLDGFAFNLVNSNETREKIREKILNAFKKVNFEKVHMLEEMIDDEKKKFWLNNKGFFNVKKNPLIRHGTRFKDWPTGRALALNQEKNILAWVNKEDHLELISTNVSFKQGFYELYQLLEKLDDELHFAFNEKYGFYTTKPSYLGIGLTFSMGLEIPEEFVGIFQENLLLIQPNLSNIEIKDLDNQKLKWLITLRKPSGINLMNLIPQLESIIYNLFNGIVNKDLATIKTKKGITFDECLKNKGVLDEECYDLFAQHIIEKMIIRKTPDEFIKPMTLTHLKENLSDDIVLQTYGIITQSFFVIRRNISGISFKGLMLDNDISHIDKILETFAKKLPSNYNGTLYCCEEKDYDSRIKTFLELYQVKSLINPQIIGQQYPFGSKLYVSNSKELIILTNYEDHFLIIYEYKSHSILNTIQKLEQILKLFEKSVQEYAVNISFRNNLGFLTLNPNFSGLGISLSYTVKLREKGPNEMQFELNPDENFYTHEDSKDILKVQLDRLTPDRLEEYIHFLQAKVNEQKNCQTRTILLAGQIAFLTPQILTNYCQYSSKEGLTFLDCFDPNNYNNLFALHETCYEAFPGLYDSFITTQCSKKWAIISQQELSKTLKTRLIQWDSQNMFPVESDAKFSINYEFGRNLNEFSFKPFMKYENIQVFRKKLFEGLKSFTMVEEKYIETSLNKNLFPLEYKKGGLLEELVKGGPFVLVPEHNKYAIWGLWKDHIRVVLKTSPSQQFRNLLEIKEILTKISELFNDGYRFHKMYGFLSENAMDLGYNMRFSLETVIDAKKYEVLKQFCSSCGWNIEENKDYEENGNYRVKISARKPNLLIDELELINNLIKGLIEV